MSQAKPISKSAIKDRKIDFIRLIGFLFLLAVLSLCSWAIFLIKSAVDNPDKLVLSQMTITGDYSYTTEADLRQIVSDMGGLDTFVKQDVSELQKVIMQLPWIKQVSVRKKWPNKIMLHISEYKPSFYWNDLYLLDDQGKLFSMPKSRIKSDLAKTMPQLAGPLNQEKMMVDRYHQLSKILASNQEFSFSIQKLMTDDRDSLQLTAMPCNQNQCEPSKAFTIKLGREKIITRLERFTAMYTELHANLKKSETIKEVDLRYDNGIAVKNNKPDLEF